MIPQEKAKELVEKYFIVIDKSHPLEDILKPAKQCALIAVDEIILELQQIEFNDEVDNLPIDYWQEVKQEIEKL